MCRTLSSGAFHSPTKPNSSARPTTPPLLPFSFMGKKPLLSTTKLRDFARVAAERLKPPRARPSPPLSSPSPPPALLPVLSSSVESCRVDPGRKGRMDGCSQQRLPLSEVVSDCVKRWFQDTLKEARSGDIAMQVLVGQMYYSGYGVPKNVQKGKAWIAKAAQSRSSVWKVSDKHPGYNASDSDSDELKNDVK